jgi:hypothetical protein
LTLFFFSMLRHAARALSRRAENLVSVGGYRERRGREQETERELATTMAARGGAALDSSFSAFCSPFSSSSSSSNPPLHPAAAGHAVSLGDICVGGQGAVVRRELIG